MTREEIIRMAREAGFDPHDMSDDFTCNLEDIERFAALVIAEKEKQIIAANAPEIERINAYIKELEKAVAAERNKVAQWMMAQGYATGHGDTIEDLLRELEWQVREQERDACANLLLNVDLSPMDADHRLQSWTATVLLNFSDAIRARGEQ